MVNHICSKCNKNFDSNAHLNRHLNRKTLCVHNCNTCDKKFRKARGLKEHKCANRFKDIPKNVPIDNNSNIRIIVHNTYFNGPVPEEITVPIEKVVYIFCHNSDIITALDALEAKEVAPETNVIDTLIEQYNDCK